MKQWKWIAVIVLLVIVLVIVFYPGKSEKQQEKKIGDYPITTNPTLNAAIRSNPWLIGLSRNKS